MFSVPAVSSSKVAENSSLVAAWSFERVVKSVIISLSSLLTWENSVMALSAVITIPSRNCAFSTASFSFSSLSLYRISTFLRMVLILSARPIEKSRTSRDEPICVLHEVNVVVGSTPMAFKA